MNREDRLYLRDLIRGGGWDYALRHYPVPIHIDDEEFNKLHKSYIRLMRKLERMVYAENQDRE